MRKIPKTATFGVIAPAFPAVTDKINAGINELNKMGHRTITGSYLHMNHLYFSATDEQRIKDLHDMFINPEVDAILCVRGGWGSSRLLADLDYELISKHPKLLIGYSDITSLQIALWKVCGIPSLSGPMLAVEFANGLDSFTAGHFWNQIYLNEKKYEFNFSAEHVEIWKNGTAEGILTGGCLSMLVHQIGTNFSPDYTDSILFMEDIGDEPYKVDRNLTHLKQAGVFNRLTGLIVGQFMDSHDSNPQRNTVKIEQIFRDHFDNCTYPVIYNFPYGHQARKFSLPIGIRAVLDTFKMKLSINNIFY